MTILRRIVGRLEKFVSGRKTYKWVQRELVASAELALLRDVLDTTRLQRVVRPVFLDAPNGRDILVLAPHPDDEAIGPGGALLRAKRRGARLRVVYLTSGREEEGPIREAEALAACGRLGAEAIFLRQREGQIDPPGAAREIVKLLDGRPAQVVLVPFLTDDHVDHRAANEVLLACMLQGVPKDAEIWAYQVYSCVYGNVAVDITSVVDEKSEMIRIYRSQSVRRDWVHYTRGMNAFNSRVSKGPDQKFVEMFFVVPADEYRSLLERYYA
jgi:LmbE family N-acetylglucosaminyl deacetylase